MQVILEKPFASNTSVAEFDVLQMKKALNRLGYYIPYEKTGITDIADKDVFDALKKFQQAEDLPVTHSAKPDDDTILALNEALHNASNNRYRWRTVEDGKVRAAHTRLSRTIRRWDDTPNPGDNFNCRCWAEPVTDTADDIYDPPIEAVYPELTLIPAFRIIRLPFPLVMKVIRKLKESEYFLPDAKMTDHGNLRVNQRVITEKKIQNAIKASSKTGTVVTKIEKYGTPQTHYIGTNGVTVIVETAGRNAGKIITLYRR